MTDQQVCPGHFKDGIAMTALISHHARITRSKALPSAFSERSGFAIVVLVGTSLEDEQDIEIELQRDGLDVQSSYLLSPMLSANAFRLADRLAQVLHRKSDASPHVTTLIVRSPETAASATTSAEPLLISGRLRHFG